MSFAAKGEKSQYKIKTNKHLKLSYKNYLQNRHRPPQTMAAIIPNTPGTGNNIPVSAYVAGITESYRNVNRQRVVESSINSKETIDFLPVNMSVNQSQADKYLNTE